MYFLKANGSNSNNGHIKGIQEIISFNPYKPSNAGTNDQNKKCERKVNLRKMAERKQNMRILNYLFFELLVTGNESFKFAKLEFIIF